MTYPYLSGVNYESVADGPGVRAAIFLSGCTHHCPGCHNPQTHDPHYGSRLNDAMIYTIAYLIDKRPYISGITLTGGDPLYDIEATTNFLYRLREYLGERWNSLNVWLYTGYTWKQIMYKYASNEHLQKLLLLIDVIVDGPYVAAGADKRLPFRGSVNQQLIDVRQSIKIGIPVWWNSVK